MGHLKSLKQHISSIGPLFQPQQLSAHPLVLCPLSAGCPPHWSLAQCFLDTRHRYRGLTNLCFRVHGKSRDWFASSATGGVRCSCGAIVEVNVKSMDGCSALATIHFSQRRGVEILTTFIPQSDPRSCVHTYVPFKLICDGYWILLKTKRLCSSWKPII